MSKNITFAFKGKQPESKVHAFTTTKKDIFGNSNDGTRV